VSDTYLVYKCSREKLDPYLPYIYSKWLRSLRYGSEIYKMIDSGAFFNCEHAKIEKILDCEDTEIRLAVLSDDLDVCLGFSAVRNDHLDYVYVNKDQRKIGIGASLIPDRIKSFGTLTNLGQIVWEKRYTDLKFNPYR
jgi:hypothetical protein